MSKCHFRSNSGFLSISVAVVLALSAIYLGWLSKSILIHSEFIPLLHDRNQLSALRLSATEYLTHNWKDLRHNPNPFERKETTQLEEITVIGQYSNAKCAYAIYPDGIWLCITYKEIQTNFRLNYTQEDDSITLTTIQFMED